ncbi:MAG: glycosyltransferase [Lachnospiraceae bacterium]|nr:glycosyltransferase [Lachnospiraceae bacterium]
MADNVCAPIVAFVYNRPDKAGAMLESLAANEQAGDSELFIYSDGAKNDKAKEGVEETRRYVDSIKEKKLFRNVTIIKSEKNKGLAVSVIEGVTDIINRYGRVIVVEDDLLLSKHFLTYMNKCLDFYETDRRIWSISGYTPDLYAADTYDKSVYLNYRGSSWGWATWRDRWEMVDWSVGDYDRFRFDPVANIRFCFGGNDLPSMLRAQMKGHIDSWAVRWCYSQSRHNMYSIAPTVSLVSNNGLDGSGTNSKTEDRLKYGNISLDGDNTIGNGKKNEWCYEALQPDRRMLFAFYRKHHLSIYVRIRDKIRQLRNKLLPS